MQNEIKLKVKNILVSVTSYNYNASLSNDYTNRIQRDRIWLNQIYSMVSNQSMLHDGVGMKR